MMSMLFVLLARKPAVMAMFVDKKAAVMLMFFTLLARKAPMMEMQKEVMMAIKAATMVTLSTVVARKAYDFDGVTLLIRKVR